MANRMDIFHRCVGKQKVVNCEAPKVQKVLGASLLSHMSGVKLSYIHDFRVQLTLQQNVLFKVVSG